MTVPRLTRMRTWPSVWRADRRLLERLCPHGVGHPDPDDRSADRVHGCDGCCQDGRPTTVPGRSSPLSASVRVMGDDLPLPLGNDPGCIGAYNAVQVALDEYADAIEQHPDHGDYEAVR